MIYRYIARPSTEMRYHTPSQIILYSINQFIKYVIANNKKNPQFDQKILKFTQACLESVRINLGLP